MQEKYIHIDILFRQMQPELLLQHILPQTQHGQAISMEERPFYVSSTEISQACYMHCAHSLDLVRLRSDDEVMQRYWALSDWLKRQPKGGIFSLLAAYAGEVLRFQQGEPLCRQELILEWRSRTLNLGQDLFTCAGLAAKDIREHCDTRNFSWPAAIRTDHLVLWRILQEGMAENHFHLNGSTQIFPLAWGYLMNFPQRAETYFNNKYFQESFQQAASFGVRDNRLPWRIRICDAAWIRAYLFCKIQNRPFYDSASSYEAFCYFHQDVLCNVRYRYLRLIRENINMMRQDAAKQLQANGKHFCLDYAITMQLEENNSGATRFLAGARCFLYQCFRNCFAGVFSKEDQDLLYLYLLSKLRFREELIQANHRVGFHNFSDYQDRKTHQWGELSPYWQESYRLSVAQALTDAGTDKAKISSLELRIMPKKNRVALKQSIYEIDQGSEFQLESCGNQVGQQEDWYAQVLAKTVPLAQVAASRKYYLHAQQREDYFFVIHFAKVQLKRMEPHNWDGNLSSARNADVRKDVEIQAKALADALEKDDYLCSRIRGIDACSHEIGCRPETFATAFRYLRSFSPKAAHTSWWPRYWPKLGVTYHAGEDFLEIADGLRAIDEAICFLNMERGDRLGHALALGIEPAQYYRVKNHCVFLPAQDLLDNLVWLLFRSEEWNISIPSDLRVVLKDRAQHLLHDIYGDKDQEGRPHDVVTLLDYYESWKLRGDDPSIYYQAFFHQETFEQFYQACCNHVSAYERAKLDERLWEYGNYEQHHVGMQQWLCGNEHESAEHPNLRYSRKIQRLLYDYHYGRRERIRGQKIERFQIQPQYILLIKDMQNSLMKRIMSLGIAIECNPSSNVLIGTFDKYEHHPIFRFNNYALGVQPEEGELQQTQLQVSANTDDQGIFDTLLENEYDLLFGCLQLQKDACGNPLISNDAIYHYLEHLRMMGNRMIFPKAEKFSQNRFISQREG